MTNEKVATLVPDPTYSGSARIKLTGEPGEATFSMQNPDGKTVTKTVRVVNEYDSVEISGIKAPVIGEKFDFDSVRVPDGAPYHIKEVKWYKGTRLNNEIGTNAVAEYFYPYTVGVTVEPNEYCKPASTSWQLKVTQPDGTVDSVSSDSFTVWPDYDEENFKYLPSSTLQYTFPAQTNHETKEIDKIYMDFPTEVKEGDNFVKWLEDVHVYTNGYDEGLEFRLTPTFGPDAENIAKAYGFPATSSNTKQLNYFIKGVQTGLKAEIKIPEQLNESGDAFAAADQITVYVNGEKGGTLARMGSSEVWAMAADSLTITDGEFNPPSKPVYSVKGVDAVVGEPITAEDLLETDDPNVTIRSTGISYEYDWEDYITADFEKGVFTPTATLNSDRGIRLNYVVEYDEDGDGYPEYQETDSVSINKIYATAEEVPVPEKPPVENYGTAKIIVLDPDGKEISKTNYKIRSYQDIPDPDGAFFIGFYDADGKSVGEYNFANGKTYYAKTVAADDMEIHASADSAYAFARMPGGKTMTSLHISTDGAHQRPDPGHRIYPLLQARQEQSCLHQEIPHGKAGLRCHARTRFCNR